MPAAKNGNALPICLPPSPRWASPRSSRPTPRAFTSDAARLQLVCDAGCQLEALLALLVAAGVDPGPSPDATLSIAIRCSDLAGAVLYALRDEGDSVENLRRTVARPRHRRGRIVTAGRSTTPGAFRSLHEEGSICGDAATVAPALLINPDADLYALLAAIESRVERLRMQLLSWTIAAPDVDIQLGEVVEPLSVLAEEAVLLVAAAMDCQRRAGRPS